MEKHVPYQAYLLRLWPTRRGGVAGYRVLLETVGTGERKVFADLRSLFAFLEAQREAGSEDAGESSAWPDIGKAHQVGFATRP